MAQNEVKILINAVDNASATLKKVGGGLDDMKTAVAAASAAVAALTAAYMVANKVFDETIGVMVDYAEQVRDLSRITGMTAEETSQLIQVADDLKVEYGTLKQAARLMAQDGLVPNIETLAQLSDQYLAIQDPMARSEWAVKNLGRSYQEMTKILEAGGAALREAAAGQPGGLILSQEDLDNAREYEKALDNLNDKVLAVKVSIGSKLIPILNDLIAPTKYATTATLDLSKAMGSISQAEADIVAANTVAGIKEMGLIVGGMVEEYNALEQAVYGLDGQERIYHDTLLDQVALYQEAVPTYEEYTAQQEEVAKAAADAAEQLEEETRAAEEARKKIGEELVTAYANLEEAQRNWSEKVGEDAAEALKDTAAEAPKVAEGVAIIDEVFGTDIGVRDAYLLAQQQLAEAFAQGTIDGETYKNKLVELAGTFESSMAKNIDLARKAVEELQAKLDALPTEKTIQVNVNVTQNGELPTGTNLGGGTGGGGGSSGGGTNTGGGGGGGGGSNPNYGQNSNQLVINTYTDAAAAVAVAQAVARMKANDRITSRMGG